MAFLFSETETKSWPYIPRTGHTYIIKFYYIKNSNLHITQEKYATEIVF